MRVAMTLLARGDHHVLESQVAFHLQAGVDVVVLGGDLPAELERFEGDERVHTVEDAAGMEPLAATELGADWIIPAAPGEFWWPRGGSLGEILSKVPPDYDVVQAIVRPFLPVTDGEEDLFERMIYRLSAQALLDEPGNPLRPTRRLVHRPGVSVRTYGGEIVESSLRPLRGWYPIEVLWFPEEPRVPCSEIESGLAADVVQLDTRVRDALKTVREGGQLTFGRPSVVDNARFAVDAALLGEGDAFRLRWELDALERRLADMEENVGIRLERKLRALMRRRGSGA